MRLRISFTLSLFWASVAAAALVSPETPARRPNIVLLLADDLGWADIGSFGCKDIATPHLDRLVAEGVSFPQFYANGPVCTPTRAALLTGRYQQRIGGLEGPIGIGDVGRYDDAIRLQTKDELGLPVEEASLARMLKEAGYATAVSGKWHLGYLPATTAAPPARGRAACAGSRDKRSKAAFACRASCAGREYCRRVPSLGIRR